MAVVTDTKKAGLLECGVLIAVLIYKGQRNIVSCFRWDVNRVGMHMFLY